MAPQDLYPTPGSDALSALPQAAAVLLPPPVTTHLLGVDIKPKCQRGTKKHHGSCSHVPWTDNACQILQRIFTLQIRNSAINKLTVNKDLVNDRANSIPQSS